MADKTVINSTGFFSGKKKTLIRNSSGEGLEKFKYGDIIDGRYEVTGEIGLDSGEADIYIVKDLKTPDVALRVVKIYRRKDAVKEEVLLKLMNIDNPSVACGFGIYLSCPSLLQPGEPCFLYRAGYNLYRGGA